MIGSMFPRTTPSFLLRKTLTRSFRLAVVARTTTSISTTKSAAVPNQSSTLMVLRDNVVDCFATKNSRTMMIMMRTHYTYHGPGQYQSSSPNDAWAQRNFQERAFTVGIGGPVGSGKTALTLQLCQTLLGATNKKNNIAVVTNDIFTREDADFLVKKQALPADRIRAVETGGCPHAAIREDVSANLTALEELTAMHHPDILLCESGGDNLAANFSRELADLTLYVIDVAGGDKVPRKGGPGITQSDLLIINKTDLAEAVGADLELMEREAKQMRGEGGGIVLAAVKHGKGVPEICEFIQENYRRAVSVTKEKH